MSRNSEDGPIDPLLADWIDERETVEAGAAAPGVREDRELLALFAAAQRAAPDEMSAAEARSAIAAVERRVAEASTSPLRVRDAVMAVAAVVAGLAIGLATPSTSVTSGSANATTSEIVKTVSFESIHEGKIVSFQLELSRVR